MNTVFITGVSRGFGLALAESLQSQDTQIIGFGRTKGKFSGIFHRCDMEAHETLGTQIEAAFEAASLSKSNKIVFINNAGKLGPLERIENISPEDIHRNLTTNLTATAIALSCFLNATAKIDCPKLFINLSSGAASPERPKASWSLYCASKAGQDQLIRTVAKEQETCQSPTTLINFNPGVMETQMQKEIRRTSKTVFPDVDRFIALSENNEVPSPHQIAKILATAIQNDFCFQNGSTYAPNELD